MTNYHVHRYPDQRVRCKGVEWVTRLNDDDLCDLLPQLVQSLRYDTFLDCPMSNLLLSRSHTSQRVAHYLYWNLRVCQSCDYRLAQRYSQILSAVQRLANHKIVSQLQTQVSVLLLLVM